MKYIVGARGSQLSIAQTNWVISELKKVNPDLILIFLKPTFFKQTQIQL